MILLSIMNLRYVYATFFSCVISGCLPYTLRDFDFPLANRNEIVPQLRYFLSNYTSTLSSHSDISILHDTSCYFVCTTYFESPTCPHSHCGSSFPIKYTAGLFNKGAICVPTYQHSHRVLYRYVPYIPSSLRSFYVTLNGPLGWLNTTIYFKASLDPSVRVYCTSTLECFVTTDYCISLHFKGSEAPSSLMYTPSSVSDTFYFSLPTITCPPKKFVPLDEIFFSLPYQFDVSENLGFYFNKNPKFPRRTLVPTNFTHAYECDNFTLCPQVISHQVLWSEHSIHVSHTSLGASLVRSFFHQISAFFSFLYRNSIGAIFDVLETHGTVNVLDCVFIFFVMKFFMCTSNSLFVALVCFFFKTLI